MCLFIFHIAAHKEHVRNSDSLFTSEIDSFIYVCNRYIHMYIFLNVFILIHLRTKDCCVQLSRPV